MFSAKAVLPIEGRPAMMMKSVFWKPEVYWFSFSKGVASPVTCSFRSYSFSMCSKVSRRMARTGTAEPCIRRSEIWKISRSASSRSLSTSWRAS